MKETEKMFGKKVINEAKKRQPAMKKNKGRSTRPGTRGRAAVTGLGRQEQVAAGGGADGLGVTTDMAHGPDNGQ